MYLCESNGGAQVTGAISVESNTYFDDLARMRDISYVYVILYTYNTSG